LEWSLSKVRNMRLSRNSHKERLRQRLGMSYVKSQESGKVRQMNMMVRNEESLKMRSTESQIRKDYEGVTARVRYTV